MRSTQRDNAIGTQEGTKDPTAARTRRIPKNSMLFAKVIPITMGIFAVVLAIIIIFAFGIVFGIVPIR